MGGWTEAWAGSPSEHKLSIIKIAEMCTIRRLETCTYLRTHPIPFVCERLLRVLVLPAALRNDEESSFAQIALAALPLAALAALALVLAALALAAVRGFVAGPKECRACLRCFRFPFEGLRVPFRLESSIVSLVVSLVGSSSFEHETYETWPRFQNVGALEMASVSPFKNTQSKTSALTVSTTPL